MFCILRFLTQNKEFKKSINFHFLEVLLILKLFNLNELSLIILQIFKIKVQNNPLSSPKLLKNQALYLCF